MIDDHYLKNSSTFSLFSKKELEHQKFINDISLLVEKYNILENENQLIGSTDKTFLYLINYLISLNENNEKIPKDIESLFLENIFLKEQINSFLEKNLENITKNDSTNFFKEINIILSVLSIGTNEIVLNSNFDYNYKAISSLFRFYESLLKNLFQTNSDLFDLTFISYTILLKTFIQLCKINSIDIIKIKDINNILDLITETISTLKFNILLKKEQLEKLSSIQGKYLFYFSHLDEIDIQIETLDKDIEKYFLCFEKQNVGYMIYNKNISIDENFNSNEFLVFKNNSSILILKLINNLKTILSEEKYFQTEYFQKILRLYYKIFSSEFNNMEIPQNIESFEKNLLNSLLYNYIISFNFTKTINYYSIVQDFIISENMFNNRNLETIYNILYFAKDIEDFKYFYIAEILADSTPIENDYHEFHKLCIFDLINNKNLNQKSSDQKIEISNKIFIYIKNFEIKHQLISIYSKLYIDLSFFYSTKKEYLQKSKELYSIFMQIKNNDSSKNKYKNICNKIISNIQEFEPNISENEIIKEFLITKSLELEKEILNKINSDDMKKIISTYTSDDDEYEINF
ncbi:MAG: hypothetical protein U5K55_05575 [Aliarcobacter sp.]|nr:hypothetical protein [Aliarcobacter sp.]